MGLVIGPSTGAGVIRAAEGADLVALKNLAASGSTIHVGPGDYTITSSLAKNGVNWHFEIGATVTMVGEENNTGIWDDGGTAMSYSVTGDGDFIQRLTEFLGVDRWLIRVSHADSVVSIRGRDFIHINEDDFSSAFAVDQTAGTFYLEFRMMAARKAGVAGNSVASLIWWTNGQMHVRGSLLEYDSTGYVIESRVSAAPTGDAYLEIDEIQGAIWVAPSGTNAVAAMWVKSSVVRGTVQQSGNNRLYVQALKIFGSIHADAGGLLYVESHKVTAVTNQSPGSGNLLTVIHSAANARVKVLHWDTDGIAGNSFYINNGTVEVWGGDLVTGATPAAINIAGGTARIHGMRIDTSANNATNPVVKSGGTLKMYHCTLVSQGSRACIDAATAQTVSLMGCWANNAVDADVTNNISGGLSTDSDVA